MVNHLQKLTCVDWFVNPSYASVELVNIAMWWWDLKLWGKLSMTPSIVVSCESCIEVKLHISAKCLLEFDNFKWNVYSLVNLTLMNCVDWGCENFMVLLSVNVVLSYVCIICTFVCCFVFKKWWSMTFGEFGCWKLTI